MTAREYKKSILRARKRSISHQNNASSEVIRALRKAYKDVERKMKLTSDDAITYSQYGEKLSEIDAIITNMSTDISDIVIRHSADASINYSKILKGVYEKIVRDRGSKIKPDFSNVPLFAVSNAVNRYHNDGLNFSGRIWHLDRFSKDGISQIITSGIARGQPAVQMAKDLRRFLIKPDITPSTSWTTGVTKSVTGKGTVHYNALRLARTEVNNAVRETHVVANELSPIMLGVKWNLSAMHPEPDICDVYAESDEYGLGPGVYPPNAVPIDHPNGKCFLTDVQRDPKDWDKPKPNYQPVKHGKRWTNNHQKICASAGLTEGQINAAKKMHKGAQLNASRPMDKAAEMLSSAKTAQDVIEIMKKIDYIDKGKLKKIEVGILTGKTTFARAKMTSLIILRSAMKKKGISNIPTFVKKKVVSPKPKVLPKPKKVPEPKKELTPKKPIVEEYKKEKVKDIDLISSAKTSSDITSYIKKKHGISFYSAEKANFEFLRQFATRLDKVMEMPVVKKIKKLSGQNLSYINFNPIMGGRSGINPKTTWAFTSHNSISFNPVWWGKNADISESKASVRISSIMGYHPIGCTAPDHIITHEIGHSLKWFIRTARNKNKISEKTYQTLQTWQRKYLGDELGKKTAGKNLSKYAIKNEEELFAEAFASMVHTPDVWKEEIVKEFEGIMNSIEEVKE